MHNTLEIRVRIIRKKMSRLDVKALKRLETYDWILFTSKHAATLFATELRRRRIAAPSLPCIAGVGPTTTLALRHLGFRVSVTPRRSSVNDLIRSLGSIRGARILFPRSAAAPYEAIRRLRSRGAIVTVLRLYVPVAEPLNAVTKKQLLAGAYSLLVFNSPSGVSGLIEQLTAEGQRRVRRIPASCIGSTTARAARAAGFREVLLRRV